MPVQFVSLDPASRLVCLLDNDKAKFVTYAEAVASPWISSHLPHIILGTLCHCLAADLKKSNSS